MSEINPDLINELLKDYKKPEDIIGENGLLKQLTKAILERALESALEEFAQAWDERYQMISRSWRSNWSRVIPFFDYSEPIKNWSMAVHQLTVRFGERVPTA